MRKGASLDIVTAVKSDFDMNTIKFVLVVMMVLFVTAWLGLVFTQRKIVQTLPRLGHR
jgi:hypothetical protein